MTVRKVVGCAVVAVVVAACGSDPAPGDAEGTTAVWSVDSEDPATTATESFTALVTRLGCSGVVTGEVLEPILSADDEQLVVTFSVEPLPAGDYTCPGNESVPFLVGLEEPVGQRELVDGACLSGDAVSTSHCSDGAVRWSPPEESARGAAPTLVRAPTSGGVDVATEGRVRP